METSKEEFAMTQYLDVARREFATWQVTVLLQIVEKICTTCNVVVQVIWI